MTSKQLQRQRRRLPPDHPLHAYVDDCRALIELIQEDPQLLVSSAELTFLNEFVRNANRDAGVEEGTDANEAGAAGAENDEAVVDSNDVEEEEEVEESEDYWADDSSPYEYTGSDGSAVFNDDDNDNDDDDDGDDKIETYETVIIGAGPAGLGVATSLLAGGHLRSTLLVLERDSVGSTFDAWHADTRFISPSWDSGAFGQVDLNAIDANGDPGTQPSAFYREEEDEEESGRQCGQQNGSPPILGGSQHPSGPSYARYLRSVAVRRRIPIRERCNVTSIRRIDGTDAWPSGAYEVEFEEKVTAWKRTIYSRYVVWCGGEFGLPNTPSGEGFEGGNQKAWKHYAHLGRTHEEWKALAARAAEKPMTVPNSNSDSGTNITSHAIVVGAYEAGVDTACALLRRGVGHITLVDAEDYIAGWPLSLLGGTKEQSGKPERGPVDPSEALSPMSSSRLFLAARSNQVTLMASSRCTGVSLRADGTFEASIVTSTNDVAATTATKIFASIPIIFCTGFDSSRCHLINQLFKWSKGGSPVVTQDCDESTISPGLFLCGPSLRHFVAKDAAASQGDDLGCKRIAGNCFADAKADEEKSSKDVADDGEGREELVEIIFCFIYKYRSRFPIVAGEILSRMVFETHTETTDKHGIIIDRVGMERLDKVEKMLALYQERGMLTNKLTCALSCTGTYYRSNIYQ